MNFKDQYQSTFSEIHASEELTKKLLEAKNMEGKTIKMTKGKKKITAILIAAALAATSAVVVSAATLGGAALDNIKLFINGEEVSASDYLGEDGSIRIVNEFEDGTVFIRESGELPEELENLDDVQIEMYLEEVGEDGLFTSVSVEGDVVNVNTDEILKDLQERYPDAKVEVAQITEDAE